MEVIQKHVLLARTNLLHTVTDTEEVKQILESCVSNPENALKCFEKENDDFMVEIKSKITVKQPLKKQFVVFDSIPTGTSSLAAIKPLILKELSIPEEAKTKTAEPPFDCCSLSVNKHDHQSKPGRPLSGIYCSGSYSGCFVNGLADNNPNNPNYCSSLDSLANSILKCGCRSDSFTCEGALRQFCSGSNK